MASLASISSSTCLSRAGVPESQASLKRGNGASTVSLMKSNGMMRRGYGGVRVVCQAGSPPAKPETVQRVIEIVSRQLAAPAGTVHPHSKFQELGADSLDQVEIVMALEEEFKISVDEGGAEAIITVQDAADLIEKEKAKL